MKILVLTKRQYMGKDLLTDRFGRFRELPLELVRLGHEVTGIALSYQKQIETTERDGDAAGAALWHSINLFQGFLPGFKRFCTKALQIAGAFKPDAIWGGSDAYHVIFAHWLARRTGAHSIIDLYDNFEAFAASKVPLVLPLFRRAVKEADGVTCFSQRLADHVAHAYARTKPTTIVENGVRKDLFLPRSQQACRRQLQLPKNAVIIGTAGALDDSHGIKTLFDAFRLLASDRENLHLALAGPRSRRTKLPAGPHVHDFGVLSHEQVPFLISALDLAVVCYRHSAQGQVSFPQKAYEIMACRTPLIAAAVGTMPELLREAPHCLFDPDDPTSLVAAAARQLSEKSIVDRALPSWADSAKKLESFFRHVVDRQSLRVSSS
jgi:glycosyltransferase involved in cell wall biosynthesis